MNPQIIELIQSFETDSKSPKRKYNDFIAYVYCVFDKKISLCKTNMAMNKYKKMRASILRYIVANERIITTEICKNK
jgi:hypothetical protein